jgi:aspartate/methionine/tyrosine aminotransferase
MSLGDFSSLLSLAEARSIVVLSDEVYRLLEYDSEDQLPSACDLSASAVSVGVMSKSFGLAGLRVGWIATRNERVRRAVAEVKDYLSLCNSAPSELLAALALRQREKVLGRTREILMQNLELLDTFFARNAKHVDWQRPRAGPLGFPRLLRGSALQFCDEVLAKTGVLLLPSDCYGFGDSHFRIGFGRRNMPEALDRLEWFLG